VVRYLVEACRPLGCALVQLSTDYVFGEQSGPPRPYREEDVPSPRGVYATAKLEGERAAAEYPRRLVVRTCGLYARPTRGLAGNFVGTILRLARSRTPLRVVGDQHCTPSYVPHVARAILFLLGADGSPAAGPVPSPVSVGEPEGDSPIFAASMPQKSGQSPAAPWGIYHVTNSGATTWYEFACEIVRQAGIEARVEPITSAEYGAAAPRPRYSVLDTTAYHRLGGPPMPDWKSALAEYFAEWKQLYGSP
jgi:dTDP-4-dehydrorhamnose reductase